MSSFGRFVPFYCIQYCDSGNVYMLQGVGGNIGVLATPKGLLLIDDQFAPLAEKIESAMLKIKPQELKYIINT